jgi:hypothetical protein
MNLAIALVIALAAALIFWPSVGYGSLLVILIVAIALVLLIAFGKYQR